MESLPCSAIVYRAMSRRHWIDCESNSVLPAAFFRRPAPKDDDGLSVDICSPRSCRKTLRDCHGVASLHVGRVRDLGLDVVVDHSPHASIAGLPRQEDDRTKAERMASLLARQARLVPSEEYADPA
ncbi:MAG: hypothetical protein GX621_18840 [Pirellulaceae bacterium]|nr:hypothetical protein [Pirellulaceae bacterium]